MIYVEVAGLCHTHSFLDHLPHGQISFSEDDAEEKRKLESLIQQNRKPVVQ